MEATIDTKSTLTLFDRAKSQLQNSSFNTVATTSYAYIFAIHEQEPAHCIYKNLHVYLEHGLSRCLTLLLSLLKHTTHGAQTTVGSP